MRHGGREEAKAKVHIETVDGKYFAPPPEREVCGPGF